MSLLFQTLFRLLLPIIWSIQLASIEPGVWSHARLATPPRPGEYERFLWIASLSVVALVIYALLPLLRRIFSARRSPAPHLE